MMQHPMHQNKMNMDLINSPSYLPQSGVFNPYGQMPGIPGPMGYNPNFIPQYHIPPMAAYPPNYMNMNVMGVNSNGSTTAVNNTAHLSPNSTSASIIQNAELNINTDNNSNFKIFIINSLSNF